jgi:hypothetical protein
VSTEWASNGEANPWIQLNWTSAQNINKITFYDRPNLTDWAPGGTLTFSDGSTVPVSGIPNNGIPYTVTFPNKAVTWVKFQVSGGSGSNVGLAEMAIFNTVFIQMNTQIEAEGFDSSYGVGTESCSEGGLNLKNINNGYWTAYNLVNFGTGATSFNARVASANSSGGTIELRLDSTSGTLIGTCTVPGTGGWQNWITVNCNVSGATGVHTLYLVYKGGSGALFNVNWFKFDTSTVLPTDYAAMWGFNSNGNDSSPNGFNATLQGSAAYNTTDKKEGTASLSLNSSNGNYAKASLVSTNTDNVTLSAWVKWNGAISTGQTILCNGTTNSSGYAIILDHAKGDKVAVLCGGVTVVDSQIALTAGQWTNITAVRRNGTWELYINGNSVSLTNASATPRTPATGTFIGGNQSGAECFNGLIDAVRIYNRALTQAEISSLVNSSML